MLEKKNRAALQPLSPYERAGRWAKALQDELCLKILLLLWEKQATTKTDIRLSFRAIARALSVHQQIVIRKIKGGEKVKGLMVGLVNWGVVWEGRKALCNLTPEGAAIAKAISEGRQIDAKELEDLAFFRFDRLEEARYQNRHTTVTRPSHNRHKTVTKLSHLHPTSFILHPSSYNFSTSEFQNLDKDEENDIENDTLQEEEPVGVTEEGNEGEDDLPGTSLPTGDGGQAEEKRCIRCGSDEDNPYNEIRLYNRAPGYMHKTCYIAWIRERIEEANRHEGMDERPNN